MRRSCFLRGWAGVVDEVLFSIDQVSIWDVFSWGTIAALYLLPTAMLLFPRLVEIWPFSSFAILRFRGRWAGAVSFAFVSIIAIPHFLGEYVPLKNQKAAFAEGRFVTVVLTVDGMQPDKKVAWASFPESSLSFEGTRLDVPGSLHGSLNLLPEIRDRLVAGQHYELKIADETILEIRSMKPGQ